MSKGLIDLISILDLEPLEDPSTGQPFILDPAKKRGWQLNLTVGQPF